MGTRNREKSFKAKLYNFLLIFAGILNISYILFGFSLGWGFYFGLKVIFLFAVLLLAHGILRARSHSYSKSFINKIVNVGILTVIFSIIVMETAMNYGAIFNNTDDVDYVYILGAGIIDDMPSLELENRLDRTIEFMKQNKDVKKIVLCGGQGADEKFTEAYVMEKYLLEHDVDAKLLIKEEKSTTTYENIKFANEIIENIDGNSNKKIALVSNHFHVFRAKMIAGKMGLKVTGLVAPTPLYIIPNHHIREYFAILKFLLFT